MKKCKITSCAYYDMCEDEDTRDDHKCDEPMFEEEEP